MAPSDIHTPNSGSLLVVAGSGRSGTSLITGLTGRLGLHIPKPEIKANDSNPSGFGEPRWAVGLHKDLLQSVDVKHEDARPLAWEITAEVAEKDEVRARLADWLQEQFAMSGRVVVKDPRLAWFLELYRAVARDLSVELSVVTMLRHPAETVRSRQMAYASKIEGPTRMSGWLNMMLSVEHLTRGVPRAVIRYDDLLTRWQDTLAAAEGPLRVQITSAANPEQVKAADELVDPTLRRAAPDWDELRLPAALQDLAQRTYDELGAVAVSPDGGEPSRSFDALDELRDAYGRYYRDAELVARSSIVAARAAERRRSRRRQRQAARRQAGKRRPSGSGRPGTSPAASAATPGAAGQPGGDAPAGLKGRAAKLLAKVRRG